MVKEHKEFNMLCFPRIGDYGYLGNAMFQYSALLGIADKHGYTPMYDYEKTGTMVTLHDHFNISKAQQMEQWKQVHGVGRIWKEPHFHFSNFAFMDKPPLDSERKKKLGIEDNSHPIVKDNTGLNGYFQSEKYFKHIEETIRSEFTFSDELKEQCETILNPIKKDGKILVSLHVRLGDYKVLEHVYVPLVKTDYYQKAISYLSNEFGEENLHFIILSDEPETCKQIFQGRNIAYAEGGSQTQDMCIMSMCDHNIIANSSFSWWGAWLNANKDKKVIAPEGWFQPNEKDPKNTKDLYCDEWIVL
tara:strand:- start:90 stop:998 length:909 start_codon:yes stop_codon:yes gene_type:complete